MQFIAISGNPALVDEASKCHDKNCANVSIPLSKQYSVLALEDWRFDDRNEDRLQANLRRAATNVLLQLIQALTCGMSFGNLHPVYCQAQPKPKPNHSSGIKPNFSNQPPGWPSKKV